MSVTRDIHSLPTSAELPSSAASTLKNAFKSVYTQAVKLGAISITRNRKSEVVMLPVEIYDEMVAELKAKDPLVVLRKEYEATFQSMQTDASIRAYQSLFEASPEELGQAALSQAKK